MLKGPFTVWRRDMIVLRRSFFSELAAVVASPLTFYLAFGFGLRGFIADVDGIPYTRFMAPGLITMTAVSAAFSESAWSMWFHRKVQHTIEAYRVTPITVYDIVIGKIISGFTHGAIKGVAVAAVILLLTSLKLQPVCVLAYLPFIILGSMIFSCIGTVCGTVLDKPETIGRVEAVIIMPLIFMSGVFFPVSSYPAAMLPFIRLLPTTAIFEGARYALLDGTLTAGYVLNLACSAAAAFAGAVWVFNRHIEE
jgi:lipooligosaccharide transport system permease protein